MLTKSNEKIRIILPFIYFCLKKYKKPRIPVWGNGVSLPDRFSDYNYLFFTLALYLAITSVNSV